MPTDASIDAVSCSFGMLHMERPERVLAEVARVRRPATGRFAVTSWTSDGEFFALVGQAVQAHADMGVPLPLAPPMGAFGGVFQAAGGTPHNAATAKTKTFCVNSRSQHRRIVVALLWLATQPNMGNS
jgi:SAM-dependent methyltransferase